MPVYYDDREIGEVNVFTDGQTLKGVPANEINKVLRRVVSQTTRQEIAKYGSQKISNKELNPLGVWLKFSANDLSLDVALEADSTSRELIDFDGTYKDQIYSDSSFFAWHNVFNFTTDYARDIDGNAANRWLGEWIATGNIGGALGLNFEGAGYVEGVDSDTFEGGSRLYRGIFVCLSID
ncbi:P pilus assembly protein [Vibrio ishigakensis]|uniref:P pilus assembly protein n=1 Tax=Vibrio ishigakensis TaxID=1481914 RepID=A0A0B8P6X6_9VIBR|nr:P pilus assembly protein [Vibrio ishigakensis]